MALYQWGLNHFLQLGALHPEENWSSKTTNYESIPARVLEPQLLESFPSKLSSATSYAQGAEETPNEEVILDVAAGYHHTLCLTSKGVMYQWGVDYNDLRQKPTPLCLPREFQRAKIKQISCGMKHSAAVDAHGKLFTWGCGFFGRLGHGNEVSHGSPKLVVKLKGSCVVSIACGGAHTVALVKCISKVDNTNEIDVTITHELNAEQHSTYDTYDTTLYAFGFNRYCQCGSLNYVTSNSGIRQPRGPDDVRDRSAKYFQPGCVFLEPTVIDMNKTTISKSSLNFRKVFCGRHHSGVLNHHGELLTWGLATFGRLGRTGDGGGYVGYYPAPVASTVQFQDVSMGEAHNLAIDVDGNSLFSWGYGLYGCLGQGSELSIRIPSPINFFDGVTVTSVTCGYGHSAAVTQEGQVYCWGLSHGGGGKTASCGFDGREVWLTPQPVQFVSNEFQNGSRPIVKSIAAGGAHVVALSCGETQDNLQVNSCVEHLIDCKDNGDEAFVDEATIHYQQQHHQMNLDVDASTRDTEAKNQNSKCKGIEGEQLVELFSACRHGRVEIVLRALFSGFDVNTCEPATGNTLLHVATQNNMRRMVATLLDHKADINARNFRKRTALDFAYTFQFTDLFRFLLNRGADPTLGSNHDVVVAAKRVLAPAT